jgi:rRNA-processing protein FCF1
MRILIDTNVLISLEDHHRVAPKSASLSRLAGRFGQLIVHPATLDDLKRDKEAGRRRIIVSKAHKYEQLNPAPEPDLDFLKETGGQPSRPSDEADMRLLFAVRSNCVNCLVTEDQTLHRKAQRAGLGDRVYFIEQAVSWLAALFEPRVDVPPSIEDIPIYSLSIDDRFFDSLKEDYPETVRSPEFAH